MRESEQTRTLSKIRRLLIHELENSAKYHEAGRFEKLGETFFEIDRLVWCVKPKDVRERTIEYHAYYVLDSWIHASEHDWTIYETVGRDDWPGLALKMKEVLENRREYHRDEYQGILP